MSIRLLAGACAIAIACSTGAFAATTAKTPPPTTTAMKPADRCAALEQQFKDAAVANKTSKKLADAQKLADEGTKLCTAKKYSTGERQLTAALNDLGEKPKL